MQNVKTFFSKKDFESNMTVSSEKISIVGYIEGFLRSQILRMDLSNNFSDKVKKLLKRVQ
jgi:hypothetical protein